MWNDGNPLHRNGRPRSVRLDAKTWGCVMKSSVLVLVGVVASALSAAENGGRAPVAFAMDRDKSILGAPTDYEKPTTDALTTLRAEARCSEKDPGEAKVTFHWDVKHEGVEIVRIDLTNLRDGFQSGRFRTLGDNKASDRKLEVSDADPGNFLWRLLVRQPAGWTF